MSSSQPSIVIRALQRDDNAAVVRLLRRGNSELIPKFRRQFSLNWSNLLVFALLLALCAVFRLTTASCVVLAAYALFVYLSPHAALSRYYRGCADYADMYAYYQQAGCHFLVALVDNQVVGSVAVIQLDAQSGDICRMSVHSDFRRLGIAHQLLRRIEEHCRSYGYRRVELNTTSAQIPAIKLYEKNGYRHFKTMWKPLFSFLPFRGRRQVYLEKNL